MSDPIPTLHELASLMRKISKGMDDEFPDYLLQDTDDILRIAFGGFDRNEEHDHELIKRLATYWAMTLGKGSVDELAAQAIANNEDTDSKPATVHLLPEQLRAIMKSDEEK